MPKIHPVRFGLALSAAGQSLLGVGGISSISGAHGNLVDYAVFTGFFMGCAGIFITTLFTDGRYNPSAITNKVVDEDKPVDKSPPV